MGERGMANGKTRRGTRVRTLFLSDIHLGYRHARARELNGFLAGVWSPEHTQVSQFEVHREWVHRTARGERLLVLHGDQFDGIVSCPPWLTHLGDALYEMTVRLSDRVNNIRRALGKAYWPLAERGGPCARGGL